MLNFLALALTALAAGLALALHRVRTRARKLEVQVDYLTNRFSGVIDIDAERLKVVEQVRTLKEEHQSLVTESAKRRTELSQQYASALEAYERLMKEVSSVEENLEDQSFGLYKPHFDYRSSETYKAQLTQVRERMRTEIRAGRASVCDANWTVRGSNKEGEKMAKQSTKIFLRAFNAECDAAIANVSWNNVDKMEERIRKSFDALNKLGTVLEVRITPEYLDLRIQELWLEYEHEQKRQEEKEEQRRIREQIREEERAQRDFAKAKEEAEKEEDRFEKALNQARAEAERASGAQQEALSAKIAELEEQLRLAHEKKERAISQAQMTRSGFVYVVSNIGSFGEQVFKVGMTRRLDPMDRVKELSDASVPFAFDVHAMLYSDNAPELERALHDHFESRRINLANYRKEFFQVDIQSIEEFARTRGIDVEFTALAEAREYRETLAIRRSLEAGNGPADSPVFPRDPFALGAG